jgi:hypothetical protein
MIAAAGIARRAALAIRRKNAELMIFENLRSMCC